MGSLFRFNGSWKSRLAWGISLVFAIPIGLFIRAVMRRPEQLSMNLLRTGGRFVQKVTSNLEHVALFLTVVVCVSWLLILAGWWIQSKSDSPKAQQISSKDL